MDQLADPQINVYVGQARVYDSHKMCGARRVGPRCADLMRGGPKRGGPAHIATPRGRKNNDVEV